MISTANITMQFGAAPLFENISAKFGHGNRYGLIGANGCGKSTFMKILSGDLVPSAGNVSITPGDKVGTLSQDQFAFEEYTVVDTVTLLVIVVVLDLVAMDLRLRSSHAMRSLDLLCVLAPELPLEEFSELRCVADRRGSGGARSAPATNSRWSSRTVRCSASVRVRMVNWATATRQSSVGQSWWWPWRRRRW